MIIKHPQYYVDAWVFAIFPPPPQKPPQILPHIFCGAEPYYQLHIKISLTANLLYISSMLATVYDTGAIVIKFKLLVVWYFSRSE